MKRFNDFKKPINATLILLGLLIVGFACTEKPIRIQTTIIDQEYFPDLSSASGMSIINGDLYVVGDDVPWLFKLNSDLEILSKTQLAANDSLVKGRAPKDIKADFEGMELLSFEGQSYLLIISSGSVPLSRDTAFLISNTVEGQILKCNLRPFYNAIKKAAQFPHEREINLEAIAASESQIFFFHRGNVTENIIVETDIESFLDFMTQKTTIIPNFQIHTFKLPLYNDVASGFSGACYLPDEDALAFTASLEDTRDEVSDGTIMGSYIGIIPLSSINKGIFSASLLQAKDGILSKKLESISLYSSLKDGGYSIFSSVDNDDGSSDIYLINLEIIK